MERKIKVGAVSYLNTKPLLYGIQHSPIMDDIELSVDYPSKLAEQLKNNDIDIALLPVAAIPGIEGARVVSDYGIAADGQVASVALYSRVPLAEIKEVYLDYQSRTSVRLTRLLFEQYWKKEVVFKDAPENYIELISDTTAGVIIGDRALKHLADFEYVYDLSESWKEYTGLPFVFAAWVSNKDLSDDFIDRFNQANKEGLEHIDNIASEEVFPYYDLQQYYTERIHYKLDDAKLAGMNKFLELIRG
ncbi:MAG: menaquinone biosynthesis protein [Chitinophagales bacterium]|nr:menaquinone biosynthesis protein [Chitinophagaceae bacterium]MCB9064420.1 menaquinone biosynthesis protein [Chitinophagales bacterium]